MSTNNLGGYPHVKLIHPFIKVVRHAARFLESVQQSDWLYPTALHKTTTFSISLLYAENE
ncbi:hypothetical protein NXC24_PA00275 (plasmid) [Rhizobium sp. NXC24]|nr:hypothetical protein NXC24_PA00275 [Rhizobium sp. NXC24]